jgi:hypothetical protein
MARRTKAPVLAAILVAASGAWAVDAPAATAPSGAILAPRDGAQLPAKAVTLQIRDGKRVLNPRVVVNGKRSGRRFALPRDGRRRITLTAAGGPAPRRQPREGPLRTAEPPERAVGALHGLLEPPARGADVGDTGGRGRASDPRRRPLGRPAGAGAARRRFRGRMLSYEWRLQRAPRGSRYARPGAAFASARSLTAARMAFRPDRPGTNHFSLKVDDGVASAPTEVALRAVETQPLVPLDTNARNGTGVQVGTRFYPATTGTASALQLVVLERDTLEFVSNTTIQCPNGPGPLCSAQSRGRSHRCATTSW